jgi:hypothetical protein
VSEVALRLPIGSREMMLEQLHEVLTWSTRPRVQLRVVPVETGAHAGMRGSFSIVQHRELTVVTAEDPVHVRFYDDPDDVALYTRVLEAVRAVALTPKASRELISGIASRLLFPEEDQDEPDDVSAGMDEAEDGAEDEPDDAGVGGEADDS